MVYRTRSNRGQQYALKRMAVNNEQDLHLAKQEIAITVSNVEPLKDGGRGKAVLFLCTNTRTERLYP